MKHTYLILAALFIAACTDPSDVAERSLAITPLEAAADIFSSMPASIPDEHAQATLDLWASMLNGEASCSESTHENGDLVETCCDKGRCCTNNSTGNKYGCVKLRPRVPINPW